MRKGIILLLGLVTAIAWQQAGYADSNKGTHDIVLLTAAEVSPGPGDAGTGGSGVDLYLGSNSFCWFAQTNGIAMPITAVHLHRGPRGETGAMITQLHGPATQPGIAGCDYSLDRGLLKDIQRNLGSYYIDLHTESHPNGALRGQLDNGGSVHSATELSGAAVVPGPGDLDPYARGYISYGVSREGRFCFSAQIDTSYPVTVHLHRGTAGQPGDLVAQLYGPTSNRDVLGCVELGPELPRDIFKHPEQFYFDVHNPEYPDGALRGQLRSY